MAKQIIRNPTIKYVCPSEGPSHSLPSHHKLSLVCKSLLILFSSTTLNHFNSLSSLPLMQTFPYSTYHPLITTMSITSFSNQDRHYSRKSTHQRNNSGELDVFEATQYFSGVGDTNSSNFPHKSLREERQSSGGRRMSLDMQTKSMIPPQSHHHRVDKQSKDKKYKQPSSPGGRLASFLNSLFHQAASKKKKSKSMKDEDESPGGRRKRRSSISHFRSSNSTTTTIDLKSMYSSSHSGFRTPPPYVNTPTKIYKDDNNNKQVVVSSLSKYNGEVRSIDHEKKHMDLSWLDEKFKFINGCSEKNKYRFDKKNSSEKKEIKRVMDVVDDDGGDSDSSSDLFELQNYDLGSVYSSGLPVYETTHIDNIKRGAPISNGPF